MKGFHRTFTTGVSCRQGRLLFRTPGPSHFGLAYVLLLETNSFPEIVVIVPDFAIRTPLGTFSILIAKLDTEFP